VASELNRESYEALAYGITLGLLYDAKVSCIHVVNPSPIDVIKETFHIGSAKYGEALRQAIEESENLLYHIVDIIARELGVGEVDIDLKIVTGTLSDSIMNRAVELDADLVVIGTESGSKFSRTPHTNLALNMIKHEKANVLLVPSGFKLERIEQIGAFIDYNENDIDFIKSMIKHAKKTENAAKLIHVIESEKNVEKAKHWQKEFETLFSNDIQQNNVAFYLEIGKVDTIVNSLKNKFGIDMMVIRAYHRHWSIFSSSSSFSEKVITNIKSPLMVCKTIPIHT